MYEKVSAFKLSFYLLSIGRAVIGTITALPTPFGNTYTRHDITGSGRSETIYSTRNCCQYLPFIQNMSNLVFATINKVKKKTY